ncbi:S-adenosyl-L-methionine-dependent methyltransferase [Cercophora newfieldiana]|uniref:S-adenosyl-L-methionine-dependent methyltransferase n=1 Tax=Cercophora newfieldiana TaxID=92897 RepID=A0AA40CJN4_9PEZI|nr:S-adenosyl-L-methionine-dependent methyltransferase [Cercophora newfieldiana]
MASKQPESQIEVGILPPGHWARQGAGRKAEDVSDDSSSTTESLSSSILEYRTIHGRTYQSERHADYWGPVDQTHQEAMDINHHVLTLTLGGKLYLAPIPKHIKTAVDIGTGTGIWAIDFAEQFPSASVIGTDIAPIQPSWIPPNLRFQIDDCTLPWTFPPSSLDYIHTRWLIGSIPSWPALFTSAFIALKPGGYLESYEPASRMESDDGSLKPTTALYQWGKIFVEGGRKLGRTWTLYEEDIQRKAMEDAGFVDVEVREVKTPVGTWPRDKGEKEIGAYMQLAFEQDAEGTVLFMATTLGWSREDVRAFLGCFRREIREGRVRAYFRQRVVWGRKP